MPPQRSQRLTGEPELGAAGGRSGLLSAAGSMSRATAIRRSCQENPRLQVFMNVALRTEMNLIAAVSACPADRNAVSA